jgi:Tat protein secretion system quality control protein TatD with DNase activity
LVAQVVSALAEARQVTVAAIEDAVTANFISLFGASLQESVSGGPPAR